MNWINIVIEFTLAALMAWQWKRAKEGRGVADAVVEFLPQVAKRITDARVAQTDVIDPKEKDVQAQHDELVSDIIHAADTKKAAKPILDALSRLAG